MDKLLPDDTTLTQTTRTYYNGLGQVVQQRVNNKAIEGSSNTGSFVHMVYDALGRLMCQTVPQEANTLNFFDKVCTNEPNTQTVYDTLGRVMQQIPASGSGDATSFSYDVVTSITANNTSYLTMVQTTDANGVPIRRYSDAYGQLSLVREMQNSSTAYADTRYTYDTLGNLTKVVTAAPSSGVPGTVLRETTMAYDVLGRKTSMVDADMGSWVYTYDVLGNLTKQRDAKLNYLCFSYDNFNRLKAKANNGTSASCPSTMPTSGASHLATYTYITGTAGRGNLQQVSWGSDPANNYHSFAYDSVGRVTLETREINNRLYQMGYSGYDNLDRPTTRTFTYPNNNTDVVTVGYDREGENSLTAGGTALVAAVGYNVRGQIMKVGRTGGNADTLFTYHPQTAIGEVGGMGDSNYRLKSIQHSGTTTTIPDFAYEYDLVGNITKLTSGSDVQAFTYDSLNRLITAKATGGSATYDHSLGTTDYEYDKLGNIFKLGNDNAYTYSGWSSNCGSSYPAPPQKLPDAVRQISSPVVSYFCYDNNGNMVLRGEGGVTYEQGFDVENRLVSVKVGSATTSFAYDASGQRVMTVEPGGKTTYFPFPGYSEEMVGTAVTARRVTYTIAGQAVASRVQLFSPTASNTLYYLYTDHLGSTVAQSNTTGTIALTPGSRTYYLPYGSYRGTPPTQTLTDRDFTGQRENRELGLLYYNARFYHPGSGRFISPDTIVPNPTNPQSLNRYSYVENNPVNLVDPSGHIACEDIGSECQVDEEGKDDWSVGDYSSEDWHETASNVALSTITNVAQETPLTNFLTGDIEWPAWTYSPLFPDYFIVQGSALVFTGGIIVDDYSNFYISGGGSIGAELAIFGLSMRAAGGWLAAKQVPSVDNVGLEWDMVLGNTHTEVEMEGHLRGVSVGAGLGGGPPQTLFVGPGVDAALALNSSPSLSVEAGLYTPQAGFGVSGTGWLYDAGSTNPWFFQKWFEP